VKIRITKNRPLKLQARPDNYAAGVYGMKGRTAVFLLLLFVFICSFAGRARAYTDEFNGTHWQLQEYKPNYFLLSNHLSKLELSLKIKVLESADLYFAYSQFMFWALWENSQPFRDLNYNPEFFYRLYFFPDKKNGFDLGLFEHESNGQGGDQSRGWNRTYARFFQTIEMGQTVRFYWSVKAWVPYIFDSTSMDIDRYRGLYEFNLILAEFMGPWFDRNDLTLRLYPGGPSKVNPIAGGQELTFRANLKCLEWFLPMVIVQLFHGYGDSLLNYKQNSFVLRAGIGF
jgi:phospholipase A1